MSADQIILLAIGLIVIAAVAVTVAYATAHVARGASSRPAADQSPPGLRDHEDDPSEASAASASGAARSSTSLISPGSTRQVARVVAFLFLASVAVIVALTRAWPDRESAIFTLLAAGMLLVVLFMDMIPPAALGRYRRPMEGIGAIIFLGLLMSLTGGAGSPFVVGFYLVVAGTALSTEGRAPLAVALFGAGTIAVVGLLDAMDTPLAPEALAWVGINAVALILLADIATAAARSQRHARDEALRASRFDALTGLYNRSFFFTTMEQEMRRSDRMGRGFTMLMLDLDDLKPVNDTFGHQWGDRLLKGVADTIRRTIRFTDAAARYGGDEFVVLLPETDVAGGYVVAEKLRRDIYALTLFAADRNVRSSASVGLVNYPDDGSTIEQLVAAADVAMYEAKRRGKNRIVGYQTGTGRVATDIDGGSGELVQLTPADDVRTGGDPVPWGAFTPEGHAGALEDELTAEMPPRSAGGRQRGSATIPVEPDEEVPVPWAAEPAMPRRSPGPRPAPDSRSVEEPPQPPSRARAAVEAPDQTWLTRTDDAPTRSPEARPTRPDGAPTRSPEARPTRPDDAPTRSPEARPTRPDDAPTPRPASDPRSSPGSGSRSDEINDDDDQPWIALPIEPDDPTEPPAR